MSFSNTGEPKVAETRRDNERVILWRLVAGAAVGLLLIAVNLLA